MQVFNLALLSSQMNLAFWASNNKNSSLWTDKNHKENKKIPLKPWAKELTNLKYGFIPSSMKCTSQC